MRSLYIFLIFLFIPTSSWAKTACISTIEFSGDKEEKLDSLMSSVTSINIDEKNRTVTIAVNNNTKDDISFLDSIRGTKDAPEFFGIRVRDNSNKLVTGENGFLSFNSMTAVRSSDDHPRVPKELTTLHTGEGLKREVKISDVIKGTQKLWTIPPRKLDSFFISFVLKIYNDTSLFHHYRCESDWYRSDDNRLLKAPEIDWGTPVIPEKPYDPFLEIQSNN
jgi:hypothetical protein